MTCHRSLLLLLLLLATAIVADGRGGARRRGRNRKQKKGGKKDDESGWPRSKPARWEDVVVSCGKRTPVPPERVGGIAADAVTRPGTEWRYLQLTPHNAQPGEQALKFVQVDWT